MRSPLALAQIKKNRYFSEALNEDLLAKKVESLRNAKLIGREIASSKVNTCSFREIASYTPEWGEACSLRYVKGYETEYDLNYLISITGQSASIKQNFNDLNWEDPFGTGCLAEFVFRASNSALTKSSCSIPYLSLEESPDSKNILHINQGTYKVQAFQTFIPQQVPGTKNSIWIVQQRDVYYQKKFGLIKPAWRAPFVP